MHGRARRALGQIEAALADLRRGAAIAEEAGRERVLLMLTIESVATLTELGHITEATAAGEEGLERARLSGNPRMLSWAHCALASPRLAAGDVSAALEHAGEAARLDTPPDFNAAGRPGWCEGTALTAAGNPERGLERLRHAFGGPHLTAILPSDRAAAAADLVEAQLGAGDLTAAADSLARGEAASGSAHAAAGIGIARAPLLLAREREIAELIVSGRTNREIAEQLGLSTRTIEAHVRDIYARFGVRSRVELARSFQHSEAFDDR